MATDPMEDHREALPDVSAEAATAMRPQDAECLSQLRSLLRRATHALIPDYQIVDQHRPLPRWASDGVLWGVSLLIERLETALSDLQAAVIDGEMEPEVAVKAARERVREAVPELRFGARLRERPRFARRPAQLPPVVELGRLCAIVSRLADDVAALATACNGAAPDSMRGVVQVRVRRIS